MSHPLTVVGTVATDPRLITTAAGLTICSFRIAAGERRFDRQRNTWVDGETNWFSVSAFRGLAEHAQASLHKGDRVIVEGRLRVRTWERDERSGTSVEIDADALGHDLRWGISHFTKQRATSRDSTPPAEAVPTAPSDDLWSATTRIREEVRTPTTAAADGATPESDDESAPNWVPTDSDSSRASQAELPEGWSANAA